MLQCNKKKVIIKFNRNIMYTVKKLNTYHKNIIVAHFLRLDSDGKYNRFCVAANEDFINRYVEQLDINNNGVYGVFDDEMNMIGLGECILYKGSDTEAEVAFSVELIHQGKKLGSRLIKKLIQYANSRNIKKLQMYCLRTNTKSLHLAKKYGLNLIHEDDDVTTVIKMPNTPSWIDNNFEIIDEIVANAEIVHKNNSKLWKNSKKNTELIKATFFKIN